MPREIHIGTGDAQIVIGTYVSSTLTGRTERVKRVIHFEIGVRTQDDMTPEERASLEELYGCPFARRFGE